MGRVSTATAVVACALGLGAAASARAARGPCHPRGSETLLANRHGRVFSIDNEDEPGIHGCLYRRGRTVHLGYDTDRSSEGCFPDICEFRLPRLSGRLVAFHEQFYGRTGAGESGRVVDLWRGREVGDYSAGAVTDLVLKSNGSVAWIAHRQGGGYEVHRHDRRGQAVLEAGNGIEPASLRLSGGTLTWRSGGTRRTGRLR